MLTYPQSSMLTYSRPYKTTFMDSKRKHLPYLPNDVFHLVMHQRNRLMYIDGRWRSQPDPYAISHAMYIQELEEEITNKEKEMKGLKEEILENYATMENGFLQWIEMVEENERFIDASGTMVYVVELPSAHSGRYGRRYLFPPVHVPRLSACALGDVSVSRAEAASSAEADGVGPSLTERSDRSSTRERPPSERRYQLPASVAPAGSAPPDDV